MHNTWRCAALALGLTACTNPVEAGSAPLKFDPASQHFTTPVTINGQGPFDFIVDTAAQRAIISPELAAELKLSTGEQAHIHAASGNAMAGVTSLGEYESGLFDRHDEDVAVIPVGQHGEKGVVGMNGFTDGRIELNFAGKTVSVGPSGKPKDFVAIPGAVTMGSFLIVDVVVDGVRAKALVDSGARRTIANPVLEAALGYKTGDARLSPAEPAHGAGNGEATAVKTTIGKIAVGPVAFDKPTLTFADMSVFHPLGLADQPAMIMGSDLWQRMRAMAIDYPRQELQLQK